MPNQTMVYSCSGAEQEYTMVWFGIFLYLLVSSLKIRFCEQSVFAKSPLPAKTQISSPPVPIGFSYFASLYKLGSKTAQWSNETAVH